MVIPILFIRWDSALCLRGAASTSGSTATVVVHGPGESSCHFLPVGQVQEGQVLRLKNAKTPARLNPEDDQLAAAGVP